MCTVTWAHVPGGYSLFCNRDEKRTRPAASAPRIHVRNGVRFIAPVDTTAGGTWIACNEYGISICLLNAPHHRYVGEVSRGLVVMDAVCAASMAGALERVLARDLSNYSAFTVAMLAQGEPVRVAEWNGREVSITPDADQSLPLVSSSFDAGDVVRLRSDEFRRLCRHVHPAALRSFHASHGAARDAYSPCMHRADAQTVSFTEVSVCAAAAEMRYQPGAPCEGHARQTLHLRLRI